jgi:hypothetical protein
VKLKYVMVPSIKLFRGADDHYSEITRNVTASEITADSAALLTHNGKFFRSTSKFTVRSSLT